MIDCSYDGEDGAEKVIFLYTPETILFDGKSVFANMYKSKYSFTKNKLASLKAMPVRNSPAPITDGGEA